MRTIVIKNNTNAPQHIRGLRNSDGGQETVFHVMPKARATLKADTFFDLNNLPANVVLVSDSASTGADDDYAARKAAANAVAAAPAPQADKGSSNDKDKDKGQSQGDKHKADTK